MATLGTLSKSSSTRHSATKLRQTSPMALPLSLRKSAWFLSPRQLSGQPDQLDITLAFTLKASARRNPIEIAINVDFQQCRRIIARAVLVPAAQPDQSQACQDRDHQRKRQPHEPDRPRPRSHQAWRGKMCFSFLRSIPSTKPDIRRSQLPDSKKNHSSRATFTTAWARTGLYALHKIIGRIDPGFEFFGYRFGPRVDHSQGYGCQVHREGISAL